MARVVIDGVEYDDASGMIVTRRLTLNEQIDHEIKEQYPTASRQQRRELRHQIRQRLKAKATHD